ncbi:uncharacterized protein SAPINGB_P000369 [Magnusiomyces paraingens]|uniref:Uncharacterized protein n=1 Tax=Magnusiomyces paraingens TaxID=2606893 RepID=A0A5E8B4Q5_9ASCO|nr:uncharacterized protein SAPINGB_P000369 [Saprochaete ingens]VVT44296.1 unnamed protein product [Saprochaete ingens]
MTVVRIYWPTNALAHDSPAVAIGWRNGPEDLVVVTTLPRVAPAVAASLLASDALLANYHLPPEQIYSICGVSRLSVLGTVNMEKPDLQGDPALFSAEIKADSKYPVLHYCPDHTYAQVILFDPPLSYRLQYFALHPPSLELPEKASFTVISEQLEKSLVDQELETQELCARVKSHAEYSQQDLDNRSRILHNCIAQLNTCRDLGAALRKQSTSQVLENRPQHWQGPRAISRFLSRLLIYIVCGLRLCAETALVLIEWRPTSPQGHWHAFKELSATAQQIDLRLQQFCYWPVQYLRIRQQSQDWTRNYAAFNVEYVLFYNSIWLIINDVIIGITMAKLLLEFRVDVCQQLSRVVDLLTLDFERTILWLMDWPGGLKLNNELAAFFGGLFIWVVQFWRVALTLLRPFFSSMVLVVAYSGFGGATLLLSLVSDLVSLATAHVYAFYLASGRIYHWQLTVLRSLFHLFRGKKRNVLRNRVDSCTYELDQLLMGTIFFTSLIFLLPTVLVFYLTFAACRFGIILVNALLESCLAYLNHFPLFAIMLYFKDYKRLPGGISFVPVDTIASVNSTTTNYVYLKPRPLPFSTIFFQYRLLYSRIRFWYLSFPVIIRLLSGQFVPIQRSQLYALLYSKLPKERVPTTKLYQDLLAQL